MKNETLVSQSAFINSSSHVPAKLKKAVINQLGGWDDFKQDAPNITNHGINGGYSGFVYYTETHAFAMKNRKLICELLEETAAQLGEDVVNMVSHFGVFRNGGMDADDKKDLYKYLGGGRPEQGTITNLMAWFAGEEVCRAYDDFLNED